MVIQMKVILNKEFNLLIAFDEARKLVSLPDFGLTYTSNTRNKSGDDCDELDADWMTVCQLLLEIYDTHNYRTQK